MPRIGVRIKEIVHDLQVRAQRALHRSHRREIRLPPVRPRTQSAAEIACWTLGCALIALYAVVRAHAAEHGEADLARVASGALAANTGNARAVDAHRASSTAASMTASRGGPFRSMSGATDMLVGALSIPSLDLRVALYADTSEAHLNRGVGLIRAMALPGENGNLGIAGHRDTFFGALREIEIGGTIEVFAQDRVYVYRVTSITIVDRTDAALLRDTDEPVITLVTCYPFLFVGRAPRRFVVRGVLEPTRARTTLTETVSRA